MDIFLVVGLSVISAVLCILLKQYKAEYAVIISLCCSVIIFGAVVAALAPAFKTINSLIGTVNINSEYVKAVLKALGICYLTQLAADSCKDAGQTAIASKVELAGKVGVVLVALPMFESLVDIIIKLMSL